jgi:uncharacterized protein
VSAPTTVSAPIPRTTGPDGASAAAFGPPRHGAGAVLIRIIGLYQGLRGTRPSPCRYWPTCSSYAVEAIERRGAGRGSFLALRRVLRCHPWGGHGVDPVPE